MADDDLNTSADRTAADASTEADPPPNAELDLARRERDDLKDRLLRQAAEFDNYRKRTDRERRTQATQLLGDLLLDLLPVVDDFDRALRVDATEQPEAFRRGVELIYAKLQDLLRKQGVKPIEAVGADFDPRVHEAVSYEAGDGHREGEVIAEAQRGYMLGDRLLRPSQVKVAKA